jgi:UDP-N-acetylmuramoylalanine--D-glutamate ligase
MNMITDKYINKRVTVFGLGFHNGGAGVARFFVEQGAIVTVTDNGDKDKLKDSLKAIEDLGIKMVLGEHNAQDFIESDLIIRNPAVPHTSEYLQIARDHKIPVHMESDLFFELCPTREIVAVTGTKGKSTTSHLAAAVLEKCGKKVHMMGNMGKSMLGELSTILPEDIVVLELSSYQCEGFSEYIDEFRNNGYGPMFSILTNLYPDHLNRYSSIEEYATAKKQLFLSQNSSQFSILNQDSEWNHFFESELESKVLWYDQNSLPDDWNLTMLGVHNRINAGAVLIMAKEMGLDLVKAREAIEKFVGVEHRLEFVRNLNGVDFYNDSTATNPSAATAGLATILELGKKVILIAGGNDKNMGFEEFVDKINVNQIKTVLLEGTADQKLASIDPELKIGSYTNFKEAILSAFENADSNTVVLLSPGATSFNLFKDEFDRGRQFKEIVNNL